MWTRVELKTKAREILKLNYWKAVLVSLIYMFLTGGSGFQFSSSRGNDISNSEISSLTDAFSELTSKQITGIILIFLLVLLVFFAVFALAFAFKLFVFIPLQIGCQRYFVRCGRGNASLNDVVFAYSAHYLNIVKTMFFYSLYLTLWSLLFIIPGIIKSLEYRMIPYILAENPGISTKEAFALSKQMMDGEKLNAWILDWSFLGWNLLGIVTCCILNVFYVAPYQNLTNVQLYEVLKIKVAPFS